MNSSGLVGRVLVATVVFGYVVLTALPWMMMLAYRLGWTRFLEGLGSLTPGDDWRRFQPILDAVPDWLIGVMIVAALVLVVGAAFVLANQAVGGWLLLGGLVLTALQFVFLQTSGSYGAVFDPSSRVQDWIGVVVLAIAVAAGSWLVLRRRAAPRVPS